MYVGEACPADTFADEEDQPQCEACPANSTSANGSAALNACDCSYGKPRGEKGNRSCQCGAPGLLLGDPMEATTIGIYSK